jgi:hypothetical protein
MSFEGRSMSGLKFSLNNKNKCNKVIIITARVHPGEVVASHMYQGIINEILENKLVF